MNREMEKDNIMADKMSAEQARVMVREKLRKVARPDSRFSFNFAEFISDYEGSEKGTELFVQQPFYTKAQVLFITPDNNLETLRERVIRDGKTLVITNYGISRGFFVLAPGSVPRGKEELAATLDGVQRFWKHHSLAELKQTVPHIDTLVTGASAITPGGIRFGKGHGYFDLEWAMLHTIGVVSETSVIVAAGHDCQIVDVELDVQPFDTAIDYIVTPTRVQATRNEYPRPSGGVIWSLLEPDMLGRIPPLQELWQQIVCK
jgi:5-formyltetrahydrofolate cyclo-ligase